MAWTDEARKKAAETRKAAALKARLARAKTVFMGDRKRAQAKTQRRDIETNKFAGFGAKDAYNPAVESRASKMKAKQDRMLDYIDARAEAATSKGGAIEKTAPKRNAAGKYTVDNKIVNETLATFGTDPSKSNRQNLTQVAANLARVKADGRTVLGSSGHLKVSEVQAVKALTAIARTMPATDPRKPRGSGAKVAKQPLVRVTADRIREIQHSVAGKKVSFDDLGDENF
jgi:hypothetical protein